MIISFRSKALKLFAEEGDSAKLPVPAASHDKVRRQIAALDAAAAPEEMNIPGWGFHGLQGRPKRWAIKVTANYRITFGFAGPDAAAVDLEDYH